MNRLYSSLVQILAYWLAVLRRRVQAEPEPVCMPDREYKERDVDRCRHGVRPADNCLMCAIEAPDDEPPPAGDTPMLKSILRDEWINGVELWLESVKGKKA